jgi:hypothetical protein
MSLINNLYKEMLEKSDIEKTEKDGILEIKNVLYDKDGNRVIIKKQSFKLDEKIKILDNKIKELQSEKEELETEAQASK